MLGLCKMNGVAENAVFLFQRQDAPLSELAIWH